MYSANVLIPRPGCTTSTFGKFTPIVIGYILKATNNNWDMALVFLFAHSIVAMIGYGVIAGEIKRVVLKPV